MNMDFLKAYYVLLSTFKAYLLKKQQLKQQALHFS